MGQLDEAAGDSSNPSCAQALPIDEHREDIIDENKIELLRHEVIDEVKELDNTNLFDGLDMRRVDDQQLKFLMRTKIFQDLAQKRLQFMTETANGIKPWDNEH